MRKKGKFQFGNVDEEEREKRKIKKLKIREKVTTLELGCEPDNPHTA